jgi:hypothetical protein
MPAFREISKIVALKPEPETTPFLARLIGRENARKTIADYHFTPSLREHFKRVFDCVVNTKGQGFWAQAEYGAGKTHFLGALIDLLVWKEENPWEVLADEEIKSEYAGALSKVKMFPIAFSLRGMGEASESDSLMRVFEEQIRASLKEFAPSIEQEIRLTSAELAVDWYDREATDAEKAGVQFFFQKEHKGTPEEFRDKSGLKKFGQELVRSKLPEGRLKGKYKQRFALICDQIIKLGGYDGILIVVDEYRSWQDRHVAGTAAYAEDEEILETLAYVLPSEHYNIITVIASQGDMPQKLSGGGEGDRFIPLYLLADKNKNDFGEIVTFRCIELRPGGATDIKDYYDYCRKEYKFVRQANVSLDYFTAIFPFQPRCFDFMRRITQNAEQLNLPTARSAIRMAWQTLSDAALLNGKRLVTISDLIQTDELQKGLNHEHFRDDYQNLQGALEHLPELDVAPEEREEAKRVLETLFLWGISLPQNLRDGLIAQEVAEAAWLSDDAVGATAQAEHLLERLVQSGFPVRADRKTREGKEVTVFSYESTSGQENPVKYFAPLKKKAKEDTKGQDLKWVESLFWQLPDITPEAQEKLGVNGGILCDYQPPDQRTADNRKQGTPPIYQFPHRSGASTRKVHKTVYGGEVVVSDRWREEFGDEIKNPDQHFRLIYLTTKPDADDAKVTAALNDARIAVCRPEALSEETREALADLIAAGQMKRNCSAPNQASLRDHADGKKRDAIAAVLKCQQDEYRRGKVLTQKNYGIPAAEIFKVTQGREDELAGRLLEKSYDTPLFSPKDMKKDFGDNDARKIFAGLFQKEPAKAERDAVQNFGVGLELAAKSHPTEFRPDSSQALPRLREQLSTRSDIPLSDLKAAFCRPPFALTEAMVTLYVFAQIKLGGYELALNPSSPVTLNNGTMLPGNRLTPHTLALCDWNAKFDKALLGSRIVVSVQKGWNEVLPYARVLDPNLKTATTPDEELARNEELLTVLAKLKTEVSEVEKALAGLAEKLDGAVPKTLAEVCGRLTGLATCGSYQEFDAAVRESYRNKEDFDTAHASYAQVRTLRDRAFDVSQAFDHLAGACDLDEGLDFERQTLRGLFSFDSLLKQPWVIGARIESFEKWRDRYAQAYRKAHRAYYEGLTAMAKTVEVLVPQAMALSRMNSIVELGPPLASTLNVADVLGRLQKALWVCPDAAEATVDRTHATCPRCGWTPSKQVPAADLERLETIVQQGLTDRLQRFKDATISAILKKAAESGQSGLKELLAIVQMAQADKLAGVLTEELVSFLRKLLYDDSLVQEEVSLWSIIQQVGAIEEDRTDEAVALFGKLLTKAIKDAKAKHGPGKRVRVFLRTDSGPGGAA